MAGRIPVPPEPARLKIKMIIIGEGPGRFEEKMKRPFIGPSGRLLDSALVEAGTHRANCHITNVTACRPESDKEIPDAVACCAPRLAKELCVLPKEIPILSLGAPACGLTVGKRGIVKARGFIWTAPEISASSLRNAERQVERIKKEKTWKAKRLTQQKALVKAQNTLALTKARASLAGRIVIPTVHPAFILRGADLWTPILRADIKRAVRYAKSVDEKTPFVLEDEGKYAVPTSPREAEALLKRLGKTVNVDIETDDRDPMSAKITCVGICDVDTLRSVIIDPWKDAYAAVVRKALAKRTVVTHNGPAFDVIALAERYGIVFGKNEDTLVAHRSFASHMPQSLSHVASVYADCSPWKTKFKQNEEKAAVAGFGVKKEDLARYNAADVRTGSLAWTRMQNDLESERKVYEHDMRMAALYTSMQRTGIRVDTARRDDLSKRLQRRSVALLREMRALLDRRSFSPAKPNDIRKALYRQLKAPLWLAPPTPTGLPSTGALVLESLKDHDSRAGRLADLIIRWRSSNDSRAEYLDGLTIHGDGRVKPSWGQVETGRPRTRRPNILNIPTIDHCSSRGCGVKLIDGTTHTEKCRKKQSPEPERQLRDIYIAAPGHKFVYFDLSQGEMRFAAHLSGDETFMASCAKDIHTENACILFPDGAEAIRADPKGAGFNFRQIAKSMGFAVTYLAEAATVFTKMRGAGFDVDLPDVETMLENLQTSYRTYYAWCAENYAKAAKVGYMRTAFLGRIRWLGFFPKPTTCANFPIQSGVADVMNERLQILDKRRTKNAKLLIYHYDAAIYETPNDECADMERIIREMWAEPIVVPHNGISFVQKIDFKLGERLSDL